MSTVIDFPEWRGRLQSLLGALVITAMLFILVVPLSHWLAPNPEQNSSAAVQTVAMPPPSPPKAEVQTISAPAPTLSAAPQPLGAALKLHALHTDVPQPVGSAIGEPSLEQFGVAMNAAAEIEVFEVAELDRTPGLISSPPNVIPYELQRAGIRGQVRLKVLISPNGHVKVLEVVSTDHERLVSFAKDYVEKCQFEPPLRNNLPVAAKYFFPITY